MALPYPEGAVYFKRTALSLQSSPWDFDVQNDQTFYSHCLIENVWNPWAYNYGKSVPSAENVATHPRSKVVVGQGEGYATQFGVWDKTTVMFSDEKDGRNFFHRIELDNNQNFDEVRDFDSSRVLKSILRPVPMANAKYMLVDWLNPFRAIYFPLAHQAGPGYEDLCVYLMIDFRLRQGVEMLSPTDGRWLSLKFDKEKGLDSRHTDVMSFDLKGIYNYLILPQQLRSPEKGLYKTEKGGDELVTMFSCNEPTLGGVSTGVTRPFARDIDLVSVINDNFGVDVTWQPYQYSSWVVDFLTHVSEIGLGFIPVVAPLMAVSISVGLQIITDPEAFRSENILQLSADIIAALISSGMEVRSNLPKSYQSSGTGLIVVRGLPEKSTETSHQEAGNEGTQILEQEPAPEGEKTSEQEVKNEETSAPDEEAREDEEGKIAGPEAKDEVDKILEPEAAEEEKETQAQVTKEEVGESSQQEAKNDEENSEEQTPAEEGKQTAEQETKEEEKQSSEQIAVNGVDEGKDAAEQETKDEEYHTPAEEAEEEGVKSPEQDVRTEEAQTPGPEINEEEKSSEQEIKNEESQTSGQETKEGEESPKEVVEDEKKQTPEHEAAAEGKPISAQEAKDEETQTPGQETKEEEETLEKAKAEEIQAPGQETKEEENPTQEAKDEGEKSSKQETKDEGKETSEQNTKDEEPPSEQEVREEEKQAPAQETKDEEPPAEQEAKEGGEKSLEHEPKEEGKETSEQEVNHEGPPSEQDAKEEEKQAE